MYFLSHFMEIFKGKLLNRLGQVINYVKKIIQKQKYKKKANKEIENLKMNADKGINYA